MSPEKASNPIEWRRTQTDQLVEGPDRIAEELESETNVVGRARHEPTEPLIRPNVRGFEYVRSEEDLDAERAADAADSGLWKQFGPKQ